MAPPEPRIESLPNGAVITLFGELDAFDAPELRRTFETVLESEPAVVVLDLTACRSSTRPCSAPSSGSSGACAKGGGELRTVLPDTTARRIFEITNLVAALDVWPSREDATG